MKKITIITLAVFLFFMSCKKDPGNSLSSDKEIYSFVLPMPSPIPWVSGVINNDTITIKVQPGVSLVGIVPVLQYYGKSISPAEGTALDFTSPVTYTITAEDGSTRRQIVIVSYKSTTKAITDFRFRPTENPALTSVLTGELVNDSSIVVRVPASTNVSNLKPVITHNGVNITPGSGQANNFSDLVYYTVTAEDGSKKTYNVMVTANNLAFIGSANGYLYALDAASGQVKWSFFGGGPQMGSPTCYQGKVYVSIQAGTGALYCLDAQTGSVIWTYSQPLASYGTPCVFNGSVYVAYAFTTPYLTGLQAIDAATGTMLWSKEIGLGPDNRGLSTPTAVAGYVVVSLINFGVYALNSTNGNIVWIRGTGINNTNPLVTGGVVYTGGETVLCSALDLTNGNIIWQSTAALANVTKSPVMANDIVYVCGGVNMFALNKNSGAVIWSEKSNGGMSGIGVGRFSSVSVSLSDTTLYAGNDDDMTYCLDLSTGAKKWTYPLNVVQLRNTSPNPVAANGMLFTNREDNSLYAFSAKSGKLIWKFTASGPINTDPCINDFGGNVFYTGNSGNNN
jgi:outer membrane protein assembly factor BamB